MSLPPTSEYARQAALEPTEYAKKHQTATAEQISPERLHGLCTEIADLLTELQTLAAIQPKSLNIDRFKKTAPEFIKLFSQIDPEQLRSLQISNQNKITLEANLSTLRNFLTVAASDQQLGEYRFSAINITLGELQTQIETHNTPDQNAKETELAAQAETTLTTQEYNELLDRLFKESSYLRDYYIHIKTGYTKLLFLERFQHWVQEAESRGLSVDQYVNKQRINLQKLTRPETRPRGPLVLKQKLALYALLGFLSITSVSCSYQPQPDQDTSSNILTPASTTIPFGPPNQVENVDTQNNRPDGSTETSPEKASPDPEFEPDLYRIVSNETNILWTMRYIAQLEWARFRGFENTEESINHNKEKLEYEIQSFIEIINKRFGDNDKYAPEILDRYLDNLNQGINSEYINGEKERLSNPSIWMESTPELGKAHYELDVYFRLSAVIRFLTSEGELENKIAVIEEHLQKTEIDANSLIEKVLAQQEIDSDFIDRQAVENYLQELREQELSSEYKKELVLAQLHQDIPREVLDTYPGNTIPTSNEHLQYFDTLTGVQKIEAVISYLSVQTFLEIAQITRDYNTNIRYNADVFTCNIYATDLARILTGNKISNRVNEKGDIVHSGGRELRAREILDWLHSHGEKYGWQNITGKYLTTEEFKIAIQGGIVYAGTTEHNWILYVDEKGRVWQTQSSYNRIAKELNEIDLISQIHDIKMFFTPIN